MSDIQDGLTSIPSDLLDEVKREKTIFYLGSYFMDPPRVKYIDQIMDIFEKEKAASIRLSKDNILARNLSSVRKFQELKNLLNNEWGQSSEGISDRLAQIPYIHQIVTTLFDMNVETAYRRHSGRQVKIITGIDITKENIKETSDFKDIILFKS